MGYLPSTICKRFSITFLVHCVLAAIATSQYNDKLISCKLCGASYVVFWLQIGTNVGRWASAELCRHAPIEAGVTNVAARKGADRGDPAVDANVGTCQAIRLYYIDDSSRLAVT